MKTIEKLQKIVGNDYVVEQKTKGFSVGLAALKTKGHGMTFLDQVEKLKTVWNALKEAGVPFEGNMEEIRGSYPSADGWKPWPHVWVGETAAQSVSGEARVNVVALAEELKSALAQIAELQKKSGETKSNAPATSQEDLF